MDFPRLYAAPARDVSTDDPNRVQPYVKRERDSADIATITLSDYRPGYEPSAVDWATLFASSPIMLAVLHIAREALVNASIRVVDLPDEHRRDGDYVHLMRAVEHIDRVLATLPH